MKFSWLKDDVICIDTLLKRWNDNFFITEQIQVQVFTLGFHRIKPVYTLSVYRNKTFHDFHLTKEQANYLIYKLDMVSVLQSIGWEYGYHRNYFQKSAYGKVCFGYKVPNADLIKWEAHYS